MQIKDRKIAIINQASNYLTIGIANEFSNIFGKVALITGSVHVQGEELNEEIEVTWINKWKEEHGLGKVIIYAKALLYIWYLLMTKYRNYEVFFISVPPMAYLLNIVLPHRFSMIIWDIYPDSLKITGMKESHPVYKVWSELNKISFRKSYRLFTIGDVMANLLKKYVSVQKIIIQPIWAIFKEGEKIPVSENMFINQHNLNGKFIVQYSGNIGLTHKVETLIDLAEIMHSEEDILFQIIGRGPRKKHLKKLVEEKDLKNCQFLPFQSDEMFPYSLSAADVGVVILDEITSKGSVPSKAYNLMSYGIPSLYIAADNSELKNYTKKFKHGECYTENELGKAREFILSLKQEKNYYSILSENGVIASKDFNRENAGKLVEMYLKESVYSLVQ